MNSGQVVPNLGLTNLWNNKRMEKLVIKVGVSPKNPEYDETYQDLSTLDAIAHKHEAGFKRCQT